MNVRQLSAHGYDIGVSFSLPMVPALPEKTGRQIQAGLYCCVIAGKLMGAETEERCYIIWTAMQKHLLNF